MISYYFPFKHIYPCIRKKQLKRGIYNNYIHKDTVAEVDAPVRLWGWLINNRLSLEAVKTVGSQGTPQML